MAFWGRIQPKKFRSTASCFVKWYSQIIRVAPFGFHASRRWTIRDLDRALFVGRQMPNEMHLGARFFAAPVQAKLKPEEKDPQGPRLNHAISAQFVRLVTDEGHSVVSRQEALNRAMKLKLDLVEVQRHAKPPVCKIMDYHKERYKQQLKEKERTKTKTEGVLRNDCKEVRFTKKIEQKDLQIKANTAKRMMERGYRVKCMAMGKEEEDLGELLSRLTALIEDVAYVESGPRVERTQAYVVVRHVKFGLPKKAGKKAVMSVGTVSNGIEKVGPSPVTAKDAAGSLQNQIEVGEDMQAAISDAEDANLSDEGEEYDDLEQESLEMPFDISIEKPEENSSEQNSWSTSESSDTFDKVFGLDDDSKYQEKHDSSATSPHEDVFDITRKLSQMPPTSPGFNDRSTNHPSVGVPGLQKQTSPPVQKSAFDQMRPLSQPIESGRRDNIDQFRKLLDNPNVGVPGLQKQTSPPVQKSAQRNNIDQSRKILDDSAIRNPKQSPVVDAQRGSDAKQGKKLSSYGIFSAPKPVATNDQQFPKNTNTDRGRSHKNPEADVSNQADDASTQGKWGIFSGQSPGPNHQRPANSPYKNHR